MNRALMAAVSAFSALSAVSALPAQDGSQLSVERIFAGDDFEPEFLPPVRWLDDSTYTVVQPRGEGKGADLVAVNAPSGRSRVIVSAEWLTPSAAAAPLTIQGYRWSDDRSRLLVFTNSARVWRANTRGDYWVLDLDSHRLTKLGGASAAPSTLMFAKFSPDGHRVGYVREHNIYVESLDDGRITALTTDGSRTLINGTFDWVY